MPENNERRPVPGRSEIGIRVALGSEEPGIFSRLRAGQEAWVNGLIDGFKAVDDDRRRQEAKSSGQGSGS